MRDQSDSLVACVISYLLLDTKWGWMRCAFWCFEKHRGFCCFHFWDLISIPPCSGLCPHFLDLLRQTQSNPFLFLSTWFGHFWFSDVGIWFTLNKAIKITFYHTLSTTSRPHNWLSCCVTYSIFLAQVRGDYIDRHFYFTFDFKSPCLSHIFRTLPTRTAHQSTLI